MIPRTLIGLMACTALVAAPAMAERTDLPPADAVAQALDNAPGVRASVARIDSAKASSDALRTGPYEITISGSTIRRSVTNERDYTEFDGTILRQFRLPSKARLDRSAGALGVEVARNNAEDARHQTSLILSGLWHDWLLTTELYRNDQQAIINLRTALDAVKRRMALRDAAALDVDQAQSALALAEAQATQSRSLVDRARVALATDFPQIPLPVEAPAMSPPEMPDQPLTVLRDLVVTRSHEIRAADGEAQRMAVLARRARLDRIADPSIGIRLFSERSGLERGAGIVASMPLGGGHRRAVADRASAEANAAAIDLEQVRRAITVIADIDLSDARTKFDAWQATHRSADSAVAAATRTERGYKLGAIDLSDLLYAARQANDARRAEINARADAARALFKLRIDSHTIWAPADEND
ncbi:MAG: transporter [Proteobacteria bacterium ST_bin14]|nr:MAG: transporter [Proteobacteria bacterium ST_bin14]